MVCQDAQAFKFGKILHYPMKHLCTRGVGVGVGVAISLYEMLIKTITK